MAGEGLINGIFTPTARQLELARMWNDQRHWGFNNKAFSALGKPPAWPKDSRLAAVVLDVRLDTVEQTFEEAWTLAASQQPKSWRWEEIKTDGENLRLYPGCQHRRGLYWRIIDLGANQGKSSEDIWNSVKPEVLPHSAGLWAAALHPKWVQATNGNDIPFVDIAGYQVSIPGLRAWASGPRLRWARGIREVELNASRAGDHDRGWGVPVLRE